MPDFSTAACSPCEGKRYRFVCQARTLKGARTLLSKVYLTLKAICNNTKSGFGLQALIIFFLFFLAKRRVYGGSFKKVSGKRSL